MAGHRRCFVVGDVGGTNTRLALFEGELAHLQVVPTRAGLAATVAGYVARHAPGGVAACALAVAGPVSGGRARLTNADAFLSSADLPQPAALLNDIEAQALGLDLLEPQQLLLLHGHRGTGDVRAVLNVGTGLGEALSVGDRVVPGEGGHADLAPFTDEQWALRRWMTERHGHVSLERVLSGPGLGEVLAFFRQTAPLSAEREALLAGGVRPSEAVLGWRGEPACDRALALFLDLLAAEAGNMGLRHLPRGGVWLTGGLAGAVAALLGREPLLADRFRRRYADKGRLSGSLSEVPLVFVMDGEPGLLGAASAARRLVER